MSEHDDMHEHGDPRVSRAYREWSDERTPARLDRAVLERAAAEASAAAQFRNTWLRPLAFAATLVVGVALLYDMQTHTDPAATAPGTLSDVAATEAPAAAADSAVRQQQAEPDRQPRAAAPPETQVEPPTRYKPSEPRSPQEAGPARERRAAPAPTREEDDGRATESGGDSAAPPAADAAPLLRQRTLSRERYEEREEKATATRGDAAGIDIGPCSAGDMAEADRWWQCIERLREEGDVTAADRELERLQARFPDYRGDEQGHE